MATELRLRGGTTAQHASFTGATKEITVDTTKNTVVVHDGSTAGGYPLLNQTNVTTSSTDTTAGRLLTTGAGQAQAYRQGNILGTVSATGTYPNLVPTGAIMESGSNANGEYVKYADGTMICSSSKTVTTSAPVGNVYGSTSGTIFLIPDAVSNFPVAFTVPPRCFSNASRDTATPSPSVSNVSASQYVIRARSAQNGATFNVEVLAIGRWK